MPRPTRRIADAARRIQQSLAVRLGVAAAQLRELLPFHPVGNARERTCRLHQGLGPGLLIAGAISRGGRAPLLAQRQWRLAEPDRQLSLRTSIGFGGAGVSPPKPAVLASISRRDSGTETCGGRKGKQTDFIRAHPVRTLRPPSLRHQPGNRPFGRLAAFSNQHFIQGDLAELRPHVILQLIEGPAAQVLVAQFQPFRRELL